MDLIHRRCASKTWDCDMPRYFSISMDHRTAAINVHWLKAQAGGGQYSFHTEELSIYSLRDPVRIRSLFRVIKNILDYGAQKRLPSLCSLLDEYRQKVIRGRAAANAQKTQPGK
ncbi:hypothetical protein HRR83_000607 [Exophiala dermatitidis]|nr:hypothetical protein HRR74_000610 [Exophiala dermatitidis]KAJ4528489.1 hypothetical protein HRR73_001112 [Exophiala dermatitidis]KAJ4529858.1 hypothetical protein HRR76_009109 [Exophiala dermatitidis]KAJ4558617.1 hypothetical protein HRR77_000608 [Exophiala dermatitidis]KAJ4581350.1 hypothetical protein HRR79_000389 [Exophiala dermatitidis]